MKRILHKLSGYRVLAPLFVPNRMKAKRGHVATDVGHLEIVSHCWNYSHLLRYQLSSLILNRVSKLKVTMTVFFTGSDVDTVRCLNDFQRFSPDNVQWQWIEIDKNQLLRRAIGRNQAANNTKADWIWFCDCDQVFGIGCLDHAKYELSNCTDVIAFPKIAYATDSLADDDPILIAGAESGKLVSLDPSMLSPVRHCKAIGGLQIVRGDVAREQGYCRGLTLFQQEASSWQKTYEDRVLRVVLGSNGTSINIPNLYRIEHLRKGRKVKPSWAA